MMNNDDNLLLQDTISWAMRKENKDIMVELIIRPECNQKCKYCYIVQHGKEIYPCRASNEQILHNLNLLIDEFIQKNYCIKVLEIFAGDLFYDNLFFEIMKPIKKYYEYLITNHQDFIEYCHNELIKDREYLNPVIVVPCNMSFCTDDEKINKVKQLYKEFDKIGIKLFFSYSTDGFYAIDSREQKNIDESYFNKILKLCEDMEWGIHPMISYEGIYNAIDNYEWFKIKMKQYKINYGDKFPLYLEVRNDGWTDETINEFKKFLKYYLSDIYHNFFNSNLEEFFNGFFSVFTYENNQYISRPGAGGMGKLLLMNASRMPCSIGGYEMCINIEDLTLVPCHRLAYPEFRGGKYLIQNDKITDLQATDFMNSYLSLYYYNNFYNQKCINCIYSSICLKGCLGAQYEKFADVSVSIPSVCKLFEAKYDTMIEFYHSIGLFHYLFTYEKSYPLNSVFKDILLKLGYEEYSIYNNLGDYSNVGY